MKLSLVFGFWVALYFIYLIHCIICATIISDLFGSDLTHIFKYILLFILYLSASRLYIKMSRRMHYRTRPWRTGFIWMSMFLVSDFLLLNTFFNFPVEDFVVLLYIWEGRLYGLQLLILLVGPSFMRWYRKKYRKDPIMKFFKRCNDGISEYLLRKFYGFK